MQKHRHYIQDTAGLQSELRQLQKQITELQKEIKNIKYRCGVTR